MTERTSLINDFAEVSKYNAVLDIVNEITQANKIEEICNILNKKLKWIVGSVQFLIIEKIEDSIKVYFTSGSYDVLEDEIHQQQVALFEELFKRRESVFACYLSEINSEALLWKDHLKDKEYDEVLLIKSDSYAETMMLYLREGSYSKNETIQMRALSNVLLSHMKKIELLQREQESKHELERNVLALKEAQKKLVEQEKLERSQARYKSLIQATSAIVWTTNNKGEFVVEQPEWSKYTGQTFDEYCGYGWADALHPSCREVCVGAWEKSLASGKNLLTEGQLWSKEYQCYRYFEVYATPIKNSSGEIIEWVGNVTDTTERLYQQAKLERTVKELREADESKSKFLANISHEIRTPLNSIIGFSDIAIEEDNPEVLSEYLHTIQNTSGSLLSLVNDILDFSKLESKSITLRNDVFKLEQVVSEVVNSITPEVDSTKVKFEILGSNFSDIHICSDRSKLKQIILNIVFNSVKFTEKGFIRIETSYDDKNIFINVTDSGVGIKEENIDKIFNEFEQEDITTIKEYRGVGLGLSIVRKIVHLMKGSIQCSSSVGEGTTFSIQLPLIKANKQEKVNLKSLPECLKLPMKIMIVDDCEENLRLMERYFKKTSCLVDFAESGEEAIARVSEKEYEIIFMDIQMPKMDGYQATSLIRELEKEQSRERSFIVALSAHVQKSYIDKMIESGCDDHLPKPIRRNDLFAYINKRHQSLHK